MTARVAIALLGLGLLVAPAIAGVAETAAIISDLINPSKLATLRPRGANPRVQKCVYWLATAQREKANLTNLLDTATARAGYTNILAAQLTRDALLRNLDIAEKLGCLDAAGLSEMRKGNSPTIRNGPYANQELSVDHIIARAVCVELDNVMANLELLPQRLNSAKGDRVGPRQIALAKTLEHAGLLTGASVQKIQSAGLRITQRR
jgi:hypothetical protein